MKKERKEFYLMDSEGTSEGVIYYIGEERSGSEVEAEIRVVKGGFRIEIRDGNEVIGDDLDLSEVLRLSSEYMRWVHGRLEDDE